eukprot:811617-Pyramimonas_sp.AAC.1
MSGFKVLAGACRVRPSSCLCKVKGHQNLEAEFSSPEERTHALGNDAADKAAKQAAQKLAQPSRSEVESHAFQTRLLGRFLRYLARILPMWPALAPKRGKKGLEAPTSSNPPIGA